MRDFFYNKGDVFVAIVIILAAAVLIYWRVGVVMDYSVSGKTGESVLPPISSIFGEDGGASGSGQDNDPSGQSDPAAGTPPADSDPAAGTSPTEPTDSADGTTPTDPADGTGGTDGTTPTEPPAEETPVAQDPPAAQEPQTPPPAPAEITVSAGDSASKIADKLLSVGAITDKAAFLAEVKAQGADSKLKAGSFSIPAGSTNAEIIAIIVG